MYTFEVDLCDTDEVLKTMTLVIAHFGRIDYAVNCAGEPINLERGYLLSFV